VRPARRARWRLTPAAKTAPGKYTAGWRPQRPRPTPSVAERPRPRPGPAALNQAPGPGWAAANPPNFSLIEHETGGAWSIETTPNPGSGSNGFASITAIPSGGLWAAGNYANTGNNATLIAHHC
jgi:hypothetical protein